MSRRSDIDRLRDIRQHAQWAIESLEGHQREGLDGDRNFRLLLERYIEIIGEAAARVSDETTSLIPEVPWQDIIRMRTSCCMAPSASIETSSGTRVTTTCPRLSKHSTLI